MGNKIKQIVPQLLLWGMVLVCLWAVLRINFCGDPLLYQTDMYTDMTYAARVWETGSLFPEGWVFGNQLYFVATPVLAALFYGLVGDQVLAMGLASTAMTFGVLWALGWMLAPVVKQKRGCLVGMSVLLSLSYLMGDPYMIFGIPEIALRGWQLFFTMCSYYACYLIGAFLAFGCYLRCSGRFTWRDWTVLMIACVFAFGTGVQSLRQTAVMICPMLAVEACRSLWRVCRREGLWSRSLFVTLLLTVCNVGGLLYSRQLSVARVELFGDLAFNTPEQMLASVQPAFHTGLSMLDISGGMFEIVVAEFVCLPLWCFGLYQLLKKKNHGAVVCLLLVTFSPLMIFAIDVMTTMQVRDIYYFMIIPMTAVLMALLYGNGAVWLRALVLAGTVALFAMNCQMGLMEVPEVREKDRFEDVASYLTDWGITTVYSPWNCGELVAMASHWELDAGFWDQPDVPFAAVRYLCDPEIFDRPAEECAYLFLSEEHVAAAEAAALERGAEFTLLGYFPEYGMSAYVSNVNLMK